MPLHQLCCQRRSSGGKSISRIPAKIQHSIRNVNAHLRCPNGGMRSRGGRCGRSRRCLSLIAVLVGRKGTRAGAPGANKTIPFCWAFPPWHSKGQIGLERGCSWSFSAQITTSPESKFENPPPSRVCAPSLRAGKWKFPLFQLSGRFLEVGNFRAFGRPAGRLVQTVATRQQ